MSGFEVLENDPIWYVNEYETNRAYGGPEEGGWWYDYGIFMTCRGVFDNAKEAREDESEC